MPFLDIDRTVIVSDEGGHTGDHRIETLPRKIAPAPWECRCIHIAFVMAIMRDLSGGSISEDARRQQDPVNPRQTGLRFTHIYNHHIDDSVGEFYAGPVERPVDDRPPPSTLGASDDSHTPSPGRPGEV